MKEAYKIKIIKIGQITHDVKSFTTTKPKTFSFTPGQAIELSLNLPNYKNLKRPFTIVSLNNSPALEFITKIYKFTPYKTHFLI